MSDEKLQMLAAVYPSKDHADTMLHTLESMHRGVTITLKDVVVITKNEDGKIQVEETDEFTTREGATRGAVVGGILGVWLGPGAILTAALGGALGGLMGKIRDTGIKNDQMSELAKSIDVGQAAVVALVTPDSVIATQRALEGYDGEMLVLGVDDDVLKKAFELDAANMTPSDDPTDNK